MSNIIWKRPDGGVSVTVLVEAGDPAMEAQRLKANGSVPSDWEDVGHDYPVPQDRFFRNALAWISEKVDHDMPKARDLARDMIRAARKSYLEALDVEYLQADEIGNAVQKESIRQRKQALRNMPQDPRFELALTAETLKTLVFTMKSEMEAL